MKKSNPKIKIVCGNCGSEPPIDMEKSTANWTVRNTAKPCAKCGSKQCETRMEEGK